MTDPKKIRAVYKDKRGSTYSCPVEMHDGQWAMITSEGPAPITFYFDDDAAGRLTFDSYREVEDSRLHIEPKQPGQSSLAQLQTAAAKVEAQARTARNHERQEKQAQLHPQQIRQARELNNQFAQLKRPRGPGQYIIKGE